LNNLDPFEGLSPFLRKRKYLLSPNQILLLAVLLLFSFGSNLPLGYFRETSRKFSPRWFILVHASIPFIIVLRITFGFSWYWIPFTLGCAVAGQLLGGRIRRRTLNEAQ